MYLRILAPRSGFVGDELTVGIEVVTEKSLGPADIGFQVEATHGYYIGGFSHEETPVKQQIEVASKQVVDRGRHVFPVTFALPPSVPHTHRMRDAWSTVVLQAWLVGRHVLNDKRSLIARTPVHGKLEPSPIAVASDPPGLEVELVASRLAVGGDLVGAVRSREAMAVGLDLVAQVVIGKRVHASVSFGFARVDVPAVAIGHPIPFRIAIPEDTPPTVVCSTHHIVWQLVARSAGREALVPLVLVDRDAAGEELPATLPGAPEIDGVFERFARGGWRFEGTVEHDASLGWIRPTVKRDGLTLGFTYTNGTQLVGRVRYRPLGLALRTEAARLLGRGPKLGGQRVLGRTPAQAEPFVRAIVERLGGELWSLVRWDDEELVLARPGTVDDDTLRAIADTLERASAAIEAARAAIRPPSVAIELAGWTELARELGGDVAPGDLAIRGKAGVHPVVIRIDHRPLAVQVALGSVRSTTALALSSKFAIADPARSGDPIVAHAKWRPNVRDLVLDGGVVRATLHCARIEPEAVRELVEALRHVHAALVPQSGEMYR